MTAEEAAAAGAVVGGPSPALVIPPGGQRVIEENAVIAGSMVVGSAPRGVVFRYGRREYGSWYGSFSNYSGCTVVAHYTTRYRSEKRRERAWEIETVRVVSNDRT